MEREEFFKKFLQNTDDTGRFIVKSSKTGITYCVEALDLRNNTSKGWGDVNPATGGVEGAYGGKYKGSIKKEESMISEENGLINIHETPAGVSPFAYINFIDEERYEEGFRPKS